MLIQTFASSCKTVIQQYGLHGIDIDWEYPSENEKARFGYILKIDIAGWNNYWDDIAKVPYAVLGKQWLSYDNEKILEAKIEWVCQNNYQGVMINDIAMEMTQTLIQFVQNAINYYCGEGTTVTNSSITATDKWYTHTTINTIDNCSTDTDTMCNGQLFAKYPPDCK
ncbi:unnamed protein product [Gordionus sp. m RMFG-2023]